MIVGWFGNLMVDIYVVIVNLNISLKVIINVSLILEIEFIVRD